MRHKIFLALLLLSACLSAQTPKQVLAAVHQKFSKVNDYSANIHMEFNLPSIKMQPMDGKVYFKKPSKFRIRAKGIVFMPKQNPYYSMSALADTNSYTAVNTGEEKYGSSMLAIIQVLPNGGENDLVLGKFWIDKVNNTVVKSQLTTKSSGTIQLENYFGPNSVRNYAMPDKMSLTVDMAKFRVPKMVSADLNSKSTHPAGESRKGTGVIMLTFSNYSINQKIPDSVFTDAESK